MPTNGSLKCPRRRLLNEMDRRSLADRVADLDRGWKATALAAAIVAVDLAVHAV